MSLSVPYAGIVRIRFDGLAFASQPQTGHPNGFSVTLAVSDPAFNPQLRPAADGRYTGSSALREVLLGMKDLSFRSDIRCVLLDHSFWLMIKVAEWIMITAGVSSEQRRCGYAPKAKCA